MSSSIESETLKPSLLIIDDQPEDPVVVEALTRIDRQSGPESEAD